MPTIEIDTATDRTLASAALVTGMTKPELVAALVEASNLTRLREPVPPPAGSGFEVHADFVGHRTHGRFYPDPERIEITSGGLSGQCYPSTCDAADAVIDHIRPGVASSRDGWHFWAVTATGQPLRSLRDG